MKDESNPQPLPSSMISPQAATVNIFWGEVAMDSFPINMLETRVAERTAELARANASLMEADRRKDEFLGVLAHELRNPLAALAAAVELLNVDDSDSAARERITGVLQRQIWQLSRLVDDLVDVAQIMRGKIPLHKEPLHVQDILAQAIESTRSSLNTRRQNLHVSMPANPLTVLGDRTRLTQVFANLLSNAAKFTHDGGNIWITVEKADATEEEQPRRVSRCTCATTASAWPKTSCRTFSNCSGRQAQREIEAKEGWA